MNYIKIKPRKYIVSFRKVVGYVDYAHIPTNNIKKTKKEFDSWNYISHRKTTADDLPTI